MTKRLTKEMLMNWGVTSVTKNGRIYTNGKERKTTRIGANHKYGSPCFYNAIVLEDKSKEMVTYQQKYVKKSGEVSCYTRKVNYRFTVPVHRIVYAWYHGEVPEGMDVDHIDNNKENNRLSNLRLLTRKENLENRLKSWSEIAKEWYSIRKDIENLKLEVESIKRRIEK